MEEYIQVNANYICKLVDKSTKKQLIGETPGIQVIVLGKKLQNFYLHTFSHN